MSDAPSSLPVDAGLLARFREAGTRITWTEEKRPPRRGKGKKGGAAPPRRRRAHLFEEEATIELQEGGRRAVAVADSGPVGALLLLLEIDRRGPPAKVTAHVAGELPGFPEGAIEVTWATGKKEPDYALPLTDLIGLARYSLA